MKPFLKKLSKTLRVFASFFDIIFVPITVLGAVWFRLIKYWGIKRMPFSKFFFFKIGIFPIVDHYYEPLFNYNYLRHSLQKDRSLIGLDLNVSDQLILIKKFNFQKELKKFPLYEDKSLSYYYHNGSFLPGDAEFYYSFIRLNKPKRIVEIGSGFSTRVCLSAVQQNLQEDLNAGCDICCIEPYEMPWLEQLDILILRKKVEEVDISIFQALEAGDILFIDSTHIIRPQGDVLYEFFEIFPLLKKGVYIHIHDIFTPKDYPEHWIKEEYRMWNEQYLLEAFLLHNKSFKVIAALNYLKHHHFELLGSKFPILKNEHHIEPGSFWMQKTV